MLWISSLVLTEAEISKQIAYLHENTTNQI